MSLYVVDLFAGAGGFSLGAHAVTEHVAGVELDGDACDTQIKAGMECAQVDVLSIPPENYRKPDPQDRLHLHASPPCQTFSTAGKGEGRSHVDLLATAAFQILTTGTHDFDLEHVVPGSTLVLEPAYWIHKLRPDTVSLEQVRSVKPVWDSFAAGMREIGYSAWSELLYSEQYGVPQTRVRAWLGASLHRDVAPPPATHSRFHVRKPEKLDEGVPPWVSMADALGRGMTGRPYLTIAAGTEKGGQDPEMVGGSGARQAITNEIDAGRWETPATTIQGDSRIWPRGHKINQADIDRLGKEEAETRYGNRAGTTARRVTVEEAAVLQGFPADHPWQGTKTSQFRQVGNAVNPQVALAVLNSVLS